MDFGSKIKELRKEKTWKQEELANRIGTDSRQISLYENNKCLPSIETVVKIAKAFETSIDYLLMDNISRKPLNITNNLLYENLEIFEQLTDEEKRAILKIAEGLASKNKLKNVLAEIK